MKDHERVYSPLSGSISHLEQTELISIAEWTSIFTQSTIKDHPIINHSDINVKVD